MKRLILLTALAVACALQLNAQEAFYIYRNDGQFNAFFHEEVDSIVYSNIDLDSLLHDEYVVQEVYTEDSIYRIPLVAIDSVGFVKPKTRFQPGVRRIEELCEQYLNGAEGMTLTFKGNMPSGVRPKRGEILAFLDYGNPILENGFIGRVGKMETIGDNLVVTCDSVNSIKEIFSQFIAVEEIAADNGGGHRVRRSSEKLHEVTLFKIDSDINLFEFSKEIGDLDLSFSGNFHVGDECNLKMEYKIDEKDEYVKATFTNTFDFGLNFELKGEIGTSKENLSHPLAKVYFPADFPVFECSCSWGTFFRASLSCALSGGISGESSFGCSIEYHNGKYTGTTFGNKNKPTYEVNFDANLSIEGEMHLGPMFETYLGTVKWLGAYAGFALDIYAGPKLSASINADLTQIASQTKVYNMLKDSNIGLTIVAVDIEGKVKEKGLFDKETTDLYTFLQVPLSFLKYDFYLFPEFSDLLLETDKKNHLIGIKTEVSRDVIYPQVLGFGLFDEENKLKGKWYRTDKKYYMNYNTLEGEIANIGLGKYTVRPLIQLWDYDIPASPSEEVKFELKPVADESNNVKYTSAKFNAHFEGDYEYINDDCKIGFVYGTNEELAENGIKVFTSIGQGGKIYADITKLKAGTTYYYQAFFCVDGEYTYSENIESFTTPIPISITKTEVVDALYYPSHFDYKGEKYDLKYNVAIYVKLTDDTGVEDWGYEHMDNNGQWSEPISLAGYGRNSIKVKSDFYRNADGTDLIVRPYVTYNGERCNGEEQTLKLNYPNNGSKITLTDCTFMGTEEEVEYHGQIYKYKSTFRFDFTAEGAFWLKVGTEEIDDEDSGWKNWDNDLVHEMKPCADGTNAYTVNYYYNQKEFEGKYKVRLWGKDETHNTECHTNEYVTYVYKDNQFTGCTLHK